MTHPTLKAAVGKLCCVRVKSVGLVTKMVRGDLKNDAVAGLLRRKTDRREDIDEEVRLAKGRASRLNVAQEITLCSLSGLLVRLMGHEGHKGNTVKFLKSQFTARATGKGWKYPSIGPAYRSLILKKLTMSPNDDTDEVNVILCIYFLFFGLTLTPTCICICTCTRAPIHYSYPYV